ncbi:hypothetical protein [Subtercola endophyticus]|uniref:hypothetical protein n=1 Tax=Subtercola endophyticus TaxID=2895559 RepID=UPI001E286C58|nr:hypothetical protein [Subtercola endophyticus]UFS59092.1 hypothetical protein LQ955_19285 [Subtercola endophyticus]
MTIDKNEGNDLIWPYWSIDLPGLSPKNGVRLLEWAKRENISLTGILIDPTNSYTSSVDAETAQTLVAAIEIALESNKLQTDQVLIAKSLAGQVRDWLDQSTSGTSD